MVCMGNICRSPLAHGVFEKLVVESGLSHQVEVDSAGTHAYHIGEKPDPRSRDISLRHGLDISSQRARKVIEDDLYEFDYILAMDRDNLQLIEALDSDQNELRAKIGLFMDFAHSSDVQEIPDPYYGGPQGFEHVYSLVNQAAEGLLQHIRSTHLSS